MSRSNRQPTPRCRRDDRGATAVEYALMAAFIVLAIIGSVSLIGQMLFGIFADLGARLP